MIEIRLKKAFTEMSRGLWKNPKHKNERVVSFLWFFLGVSITVGYLIPNLVYTYRIYI